MRAIFSILFLLITSNLLANHLVGGEITYTCTGNNNYQIHLRIYRDCNSTGAPFDPQAAITIFRTSNNSIYTTLLVNKGPNIPLPLTTSNPCMQSPPNICTEYANYITTINLPPINGGYTITYQRCCRNSTITNVPNPSTWGSTYTVEIPSMDNCNSAPEFNTIPPVVMCINSPMNIDCSTNEPDGDSLFYNLCHVLHGGGQTNNTTNQNCATCPMPIPAQPPTYSVVPLLTPNTASNPIPAVGGSIQIHPTTGMLTGTPSQIGQYVVGICVEEYRNGQLLNVVRRDYQFNVVSCLSNVVAGIVPQSVDTSTVCSGKTISFQEDALNAVTYSWDFGENATLRDTSNLPNPTWTYTDTGYFIVRLIINEGWPCSDTAYEIFHVQSPIGSNFDMTGNPCEGNTNLNFNVINPANDASYTWMVYGPTNSSSTGPNPGNLNLNQAGNYTIKLIATRNGCSDSTIKFLTIHPYPNVDFPLTSISDCAPYHFLFTPQITSGTKLHFLWDYGDGTTSTDSIANHEYLNPGVYSIHLTAYTTEGCIDTIQYNFNNIIEVLPSPQANISINHTEVSIYNPYITVNALNTPSNGGFEFHMDDGTIYANQLSVIHQYLDTGHYRVQLISWNSYGCFDTAMALVQVKPEVLVFFPNAFTPNSDYTNDNYRPITSGLSQYNFSIHDRWGVLVFETTDPSETWNGRVNNTGLLCPAGAYVAKVKGVDQEGNAIEKWQTILLYR